MILEKHARYLVRAYEFRLFVSKSFRDSGIQVGGNIKSSNNSEYVGQDHFTVARLY